jgi:hypothetical protein
MEPAWLAYLAPGVEEFVLEAGAEPVRAVLFGGEPFEARSNHVVNIIGRTHDEVVEARSSGSGDRRRSGRGGAVRPRDRLRRAALPAPDLPNVTLRPRRR